MKILRVVLVLFLVAVFVVAAGVVYLFAPATIPETSRYAIDAAALERAARSVPGELPVRVNHVKLGQANMPRAALFSGFDFSPHPMVHGVYQVVWADGSYALVDAGFGQEIFDQMSGGAPDASFDGAAFEALTDALTGARVVVITHEHLDHIQGLAHAGSVEALAPRLFLNRAQHENPATAELVPRELLDATTPVDVSGAHGVAPGIAVLPAAGHTPGSQLVFVRLQDGRGFLFLGDVAWDMDMVFELAYRPRLVTDLFLGEDRDAVMAQLRTLHGMRADDPSMRLVASHDADQLEALQRDGALGRGLEIR